MPLADHQVSSAVIHPRSGESLPTLPTPELPASDWADHHELARTVLSDVAEAARQEARAQGYAVGWAQGRRDGRAAADRAAAEAEAARVETEARRDAEHEAALAALAKAADEVRGLLADLAGAIETQGTELAWALTEQLVGREVAVATAPDVVRRVLQVLPAVPTASVRLHPDVVAGATEELREHGLLVVADPALDRADALVECDGSITDLRISSAMERVREVLS